jgi:DNA ligase (NAD+)
VANLNPVLLAGSTVSRATLHNEEEVARKDVRVGDTVVIEKGGDVIPKVVEVVVSLRPDGAVAWEAAGVCPECGAVAGKIEGEVVRRCPNASCPAQLKGRLLHFARREAMDIDGLGDAVVDLLTESKLVRDCADLYRLKVEDVGPLLAPKAKTKTWQAAQNLLAGIEQSKTRELRRLIFGLGIRFVGERAALLLARHFRGLDALANASVEEIDALYEIGPAVAQSVHGWFRQEGNRSLIERLRAAGVRVADEAAGLEAQTFAGMQFVLTGGLERMTRDEAKAAIELRGGRVTSAVSKKTSVVVVGKDPGSKHDKARELGIRCVDEQEFRALLGEP